MRFLKSFLYAFNGLKTCLISEKNFQIQFSIAILVGIAGFYFQISSIEWILILICMSMVLSLEMINSAIEKSIDFVSADYHDTIKKIKDIAAGAVLLASIISLIIGCIIFIPKLA